MLEKIKSNLAYTLCTFLGLFNFILFIFPYLAVTVKSTVYGYSDSGSATASGYDVMDLWDSDFFGGTSSFVQILILIVGIVLLIIGTIGLLKAFGVLTTLPEKIEEYTSKKYAILGLLAFAALNALLFVCLFIFSFTGSTTETSTYYGSTYKHTTDVSLHFGAYVALILSVGAIAVLKYFADKLPQGGATESVEYVCTKCGKKAKASEKFCNACGGAIEKKVKLPVEYVCTKCGKKAKATDKFCSACGGAVEKQVKRPMEYVCSQCGASAKATDKFCILCGGTIDAKEKTMKQCVCSKCGAAAKEGDKFCMVCGGAIETKTVETTNA